MQRGEIHNRDRARQLKDYSSLCFGNITPTDIDGLIEYHGKAYVIIELKYGDAPLAYGQKLALERLTDDINKPSICLIASHGVKNPDEDIDVAQAAVIEYRYHKAWRTPKSQSTVKDMVDKFLGLVNGNSKRKSGMKA